MVERHFTQPRSQNMPKALIKPISRAVTSAASAPSDDVFSGALFALLSVYRPALSRALTTAWPTCQWGAKCGAKNRLKPIAAQLYSR